MPKKSTQVLKKVLNLPPAIGDWTKIKKKDLAYDFPSREYFPKLSSGQLEKLHLIHYQIGQAWQELFSQIFEQAVLLEAVVAEQLKYRSFSEAVKSALVQANIKTERGEVIFCLEAAVAELLVDCALGGRGKELSLSFSATEIEKTVLREVLQEALAEYQKVTARWWRKSLSLMDCQTGGLKNYFMSDEDYIFLVTITLNFGEGQKGQIFLGYADELLKPVLESLGQMLNNNVSRKVVLNEKTLEGILVPISSELGTTTLTTGELARIRLGDVVSLDKKAGSPAYVIIGQKVPLKANVGAYHGRLSLQLVGGQGSGVLFAGQPAEVTTPRSFSEIKNSEEKESGEAMVSEKYFDKGLSEYALEEDKNKFEGETAELYDETGTAREEPYTEEEEAEDYGFSLDEE